MVNMVTHWEVQTFNKQEERSKLQYIAVWFLSTYNMHLHPMHNMDSIIEFLFVQYNHSRGSSPSRYLWLVSSYRLSSLSLYIGEFTSNALMFPCIHSDICVIEDIFKIIAFYQDCKAWWTSAAVNNSAYWMLVSFTCFWSKTGQEEAMQIAEAVWPILAGKTTSRIITCRCW